MAALLSVVVKSLTYLMVTSSFTSMMTVMTKTMITRVIVMTVMSARDVFAVMENPLSANQLTAHFFNHSAALIRDRATVMEILLMCVA